jgi:hypothetical protein
VAEKVPPSEQSLGLAAVRDPSTFRDAMISNCRAVRNSQSALQDHVSIFFAIEQK